MHTDDYRLLAGALLTEHDSAAESGRRAVLYVERTALRIAARLHDQYRTFDPVRFMLDACGVPAVDQLAPEVRGEVTALAGSDRRRPRLRDNIDPVVRTPDTSRGVPAARARHRPGDMVCERAPAI